MIACPLRSSPSEGERSRASSTGSSQREWLVQADHELVGPADADLPYDEGDLCGWDEMMPTISACRYPGTDLDLSDHGELWQWPWTVVTHATNSIVMAVAGSLDYDFERAISLEGERITVHYRVVAGA